MLNTPSSSCEYILCTPYCGNDAPQCSFPPLLPLPLPRPSLTLLYMSRLYVTLYMYCPLCNMSSIISSLFF